jgi:peroxiredoxin
MKRPLLPVLLVVCVLYLPARAAAQGKLGEESKDFPPVAFNNGQKYHLSDFKGKVVVLYLFDGTWKESKRFVVNANEVVKKYKDQPIKFFAVGAGTPPVAAFAFARGTGLAMPTFADNLGLLQSRVGQKIAGQKTVRFVVIGPEGLIVEEGLILMSSGPNEISMTKSAVDMALDKQKVEWKYNVKDFDPKLEPALQAFEWNQYEAGMKLLAPLRKSKAKGKKSEALVKSADLLYAEIKKQGEAWKEEADQAAEEKPIKAYDLYLKVRHVFAGDEMAKEVAASLKKLAANKTVAKELAARKEMLKLEGQLAQMSMVQRAQAASLCKALAKRFPGTPTADEAQSLAKELTEKAEKAP